MLGTYSIKGWGGASYYKVISICGVYSGWEVNKADVDIADLDEVLAEDMSCELIRWLLTSRGSFWWL